VYGILAAELGFNQNPAVPISSHGGNYYALISQQFEGGYYLRRGKLQKGGGMGGVNCVGIWWIL